MNNSKWEVQVYTANFGKISYWVGYQSEAREYVTYTLERGCRMTDERGVETYIPVHRIHKVKIIPPDVTPGITKSEYK